MTFKKSSALLLLIISCRNFEPIPTPKVNECRYLIESVICQQSLSDLCTKIDETSFECPADLTLGYSMLSPMDQIKLIEHENALQQKVLDLTIRCGSRCQ